MKILILGVTGMLGNTIFKYFSNLGFDVLGTIRSSNNYKYFPTSIYTKIIADINAKELNNIVELYSRVLPDIVINCVGAIKQVNEGNNPLEAIPINSLLPHFLADLCKKNGSRLIHFSTDCVFSGEKGDYTEQDTPDARDIYGRSKLLGEVEYYPAVTIRTSIIGHELESNKSLISWFLSQKQTVKGYRRAIYSGLPTIEIAHIVKKIITEHQDLTGLYHVASSPISKYDLLNIVKEVYNKQIDIIPSDELIIDRSLSASLFNKTTGYCPQDWKKLIEKMYDFQQNGV